MKKTCGYFNSPFFIHKYDNYSITNLAVLDLRKRIIHTGQRGKIKHIKHGIYIFLLHDMYQS